MGRSHDEGAVVPRFWTSLTLLFVSGAGCGGGLVGRVERSHPVRPGLDDPYSEVIAYLDTKPLSYQLSYYEAKARQLNSRLPYPGAEEWKFLLCLAQALADARKLAVLDALEAVADDEQRVAYWGVCSSRGRFHRGFRELLAGFVKRRRTPVTYELALRIPEFPQSWPVLVALVKDRDWIGADRLWAVEGLCAHASDEFVEQLKEKSLLEDDSPTSTVPRRPDIGTELRRLLKARESTAPARTGGFGGHDTQLREGTAGDRSR